MSIRNDAPSQPSLWADPAADEAWTAQSRLLGLSLDASQRAAFDRFYALLCEANRTTNLTRITAPQDFLYRSLLDSLALSPCIPPGSRVVDVGSGAGLPAIPLAIARPDLHITALEATGKKCRFIESVRETLALERLTVLPMRSEDAGQDPCWREQFDIVTARAVAPLPVLLELCLPLAKVGGRFLAMKGEQFEDELAASRKAVHVLKCELQALHQWESGPLAKARILEFAKRGPTPAAYPRPAGTPSKKPL